MRRITVSRVRHSAYIALFASLLVICTWIAVPTQPPFTMQTFAVFCASLCLGRRAAISVGVYLALGALGVPVFALWSGGIGHLAGPTGGFILGFLPAAFLAGWIGEKSKHSAVRIAGCAAGMLLCYALGTFWYAYTTGGTGTVTAALLSCVLPFLVPDGIKIVLAAVLSRILVRHVVFFGTDGKK